MIEKEAPTSGTVQRRQRLGGPVNFYYKNVALYGRKVPIEYLDITHGLFISPSSKRNKIAP
jgi:hypothetical protein